MGWVILALLLALTLSAGIFIARTVRKAPRISTLDAVPRGYRSTVTDDQGNVVLNLSKEDSNRVYVRLYEIPEDLQHAVVAIEDERFYDHAGIDLRGILRAFFRGIKNGAFTEGASTITQQLLKNNVFTGWMGESTFREKLERKIQEQFLALALEKKVTKAWILENYLNTINLGGGNWGVETAARYYFDKDVSDLSLSECAVLAGITRNPTTFNPRLHPENSEGRRKLILSYMKEQGYITEEEEREALADDVYARIAEVAENGHSAETMSYFEDSLVYEVIGDLIRMRGLTETEAWELLYSGGLTIRSTENSALQAALEEAAVGEALPDGAQLAAVVIDNDTGAVRAMVGGSGIKEASLTLNRASSVVRQPGSTIKVIGAYAAALNGGDITLGSIYDDAPYAYSNGTKVVNASGTYGGMTTVRSAIVSSNNIVALKCFQEEGMNAVMGQLRAFGISTLTKQDEVEALALGGTYGGVTDLELTAAYSALARGGEYREPVYYSEILDRDGKVLLENTQAVRQAVSPDTAALLTDVLAEAMKSGTGQGAALSAMPCAGKSGTTSDIRDAWFVGYTPYMTCGVWGGYDDNRAQEDGGYVQEIWRQVMEEAHEGLAAASFRTAENGEYRFICTKCGKLAVEGLCDVTVQGDMTAREFFAAGTAPDAYCDCHVSVELCKDSHHLANGYCKETETRIYLRHATEGTADEAYVLPEAAETECTEHRSFWSDLFGGNGSPGWDSGPSDDDPYNGGGGSSGWGGLFGGHGNGRGGGLFGGDTWFSGIDYGNSGV